MEKQKQSKRIQIILFVAGFIFACGGIHFLVNGINTYINQFAQKDWSVTTATVINVDEYYSGHKSRSTRYNILYQYEAEGNVYTGEIYRNNASKKLGETFEIKYNPDAPKESTRYLEPTFGIVVSSVIGFIVFGFIGFRMIRSALPKKKKGGLEPDSQPSAETQERSSKTIHDSIGNIEIRQNENRIFNEVCEMVRTLKEKHPSVEYVVRLECSAHLKPNSDMPIRYSAWIFVSLCRNRTILESGEDSGEWPGACDEIIQVKGKNKRLIISDTYKSLLLADLEAATASYESSYFTYVENKKASDEMLAQACRVEWIE